MGYTRERVPLDWAATQMNLGNALERLGERESGGARLEEAVSAYRAALQEYTRERVPLDWAKSFGNQGVTLMLIAERTDDGAMAETAAKTAREGADAPTADYFEAQLPRAQSLVEHWTEADLKKESAKP